MLRKNKKKGNDGTRGEEVMRRRGDEVKREEVMKVVCVLKLHMINITQVFS